MVVKSNSIRKTCDSRVSVKIMETENITQQQPEQVKTQPKKDDRADFLEILKQSLKRAVFFIFLFSSAINILMLILPIYSLQVFDRVLSSGSIPTLTALPSSKT